MLRFDSNKLLIILTLPVALFAENQGLADNQNPAPQDSNAGSTAQQYSSNVLRRFVPDDTQKLLPGDVISFVVHEDEDPPIQLAVKENGWVSFPYVGFFDVKGKTPKQVSDALKIELEKKHYYTATVFINVERSTRVRGTISIMGKGINRGGEFPIPANSEFKVSNALLKVMLTKFSKLKAVRLIRTEADGTQNTYEFDARPILNGEASKWNVVLQDGDTLIIPKKSVITGFN